MTDTPIRDAATLILLRDHQSAPKVLMGQRGAKAAFMPNKFVFPGGAVDALDHNIPLIDNIAPDNARQLSEHATPNGLAHALQVAAIRELWEETGLTLGRTAPWPDAPQDWSGFAGTGQRPSAGDMRFFLRAITPPGRPRRFDARFFMVAAEKLGSDLDDFSAASDELSHLQWIALDEVDRFDLPFITGVALAEVQRILRDGGQTGEIPFFKNQDEDALAKTLGGLPPISRVRSTGPEAE